MTSIAPSLALASSWRSLATAAVAQDPGAAPALTQDRAFTAFASAVLGALGAPADAAGATSADPGSRVGDVALALKHALETSGGSGDAVGSLVSSVQAALDQAAKALGDAGYAADAVRGFIGQFTNALSDQLNALANQAAASVAPAAPPPTATAAPAAAPALVAAPAATPAAQGSAFEADYRLTERGALELVTTQGDVVRIGFRSTSAGAVTGASAAGAAGLAAYAAVSAYSSGQFSISVQGSLNADELKAINDVLGQVSSLAAQFFAGNLSEAFASAASLGVDPTEIAGLALRLSVRASLQIASVGDGPAPAAAASATDAATAAATAPATDGTAPSDAATPATTVPAAPAAPAAADGAVPTPAPTAIGGGLSSVLDYLQQVLDALGSTTVNGTVTITARAKLRLLASAVGTATITPQEKTAAGVLQAVVAATG